MPDERRFGRRTDGPTGRRRALRERVNLAVSLYSIDQSRVAYLADLSQTGCRISGMGLPEVGQDILLSVAEVEFFGRVVWKEGASRGIQFDEPITDESLQDVRQAVDREHGKQSSEPDIIDPEGRRKPKS